MLVYAKPSADTHKELTREYLLRGGLYSIARTVESANTISSSGVEAFDLLNETWAIQVHTDARMASVFEDEASMNLAIRLWKYRQAREYTWNFSPLKYRLKKVNIHNGPIPDVQVSDVKPRLIFKNMEVSAMTAAEPTKRLYGKVFVNLELGNKAGVKCCSIGRSNSPRKLKQDALSLMGQHVRIY